MVRHIRDQPPLAENDGPIGLVMAPARELAVQIHEVAKRLCRGLGVRTTCVYGGAPIRNQIDSLKRGSELVVCTPGRMIDILCMNATPKRDAFLRGRTSGPMFDMAEPQTDDHECHSPSR